MNKKTKSDPRELEESASFEEHLAALEQVVQKLEAGQLGLGDSLQFFEQGLGHLRACQRRLQEAEERIALVLSVDAEGQAELKPMDLSAASAAVPGESRARKRGGAAGGRGDHD